MTKKERKKEFLENRTSWRWFERVYKKNSNEQSLDSMVLLEILKELQFLNDKGK
jgi:hypothetical protein